MAETDLQADLQEWAGQVRLQAQRRLGRKDDRALAKNLVQAMQKQGRSITPQTAQSWLAGHDAPRSQQFHDALMHAIGLPVTTRPHEKDHLDDTIFAGPKYHMAQSRAGLESLFESFRGKLAGLEPPSPPPPPPAQNPPRAVSSRKTPGAEVSLGNQQLGRDVFSKLEYLTMLEETSSVPQYLKILHNMAVADGISKKTLAARLDVSAGSMSRYESGEQTPERSVLENYRKQFPGAYPRLEDLIIRQRLDTAAAAARVGNKATYASMLRHMPSAYWQAVLEKSTYPQAWAAKEDKPSWDDVILPIVDRAEYLRAGREAFEVTFNDLNRVGVSRHTSNSLSIAAQEEENQVRTMSECIRVEMERRQAGEIPSETPELVTWDALAKHPQTKQNFPWARELNLRAIGKSQLG